MFLEHISIILWVLAYFLAKPEVHAHLWLSCPNPGISHFWGESGRSVASRNQDQGVSRARCQSTGSNAKENQAQNCLQKSPVYRTSPDSALHKSRALLFRPFCRLHTIYTTSKLESHKARSYAVISALYIFLLSLNFSHFLGIISLLMTTILYWLYFPHCIFHIHDIHFVTGSLYHFISLTYLSPLSNALSTDNHMFLLSVTLFPSCYAWQFVLILRSHI